MKPVQTRSRPRQATTGGRSHFAQIYQQKKSHRAIGLYLSKAIFRGKGSDIRMMQSWHLPCPFPLAGILSRERRRCIKKNPGSQIQVIPLFIFPICSLLLLPSGYWTYLPLLERLRHPSNTCELDIQASTRKH